MYEIEYELLAKHALTARQRRDTNLVTLRGLVEGIAIDSVINPKEHHELNEWILAHSGQGLDLGYNHLLDALRVVISDGVVTAEERDDLLDMIDAENSEGYYRETTNLMQEFHGIMAGIAIDGKVSVTELTRLQGWMENHPSLAASWPFTETSSLITSIMADGEIDEKEHAYIVNWCRAFCDEGGRKTLMFDSQVDGFMGVLACDPQIEFTDRSFNFTGVSYVGPRRVLCSCAIQAGGIFDDGINRNLDYLVYCGGGQGAWAYACYGRKVEAVMQARMKGSKTLIISEADFWDALADRGIEKP